MVADVVAKHLVEAAKFFKEKLNVPIPKNLIKTPRSLLVIGTSEFKGKIIPFFYDKSQGKIVCNEQIIKEAIDPQNRFVESIPEEEKQYVRQIFPSADEKALLYLYNTIVQNKYSQKYLLRNMIHELYHLLIHKGIIGRPNLLSEEERKRVTDPNYENEEIGATLLEGLISDEPTLTTQAHPEFLTQKIRNLIDEFNKIREEKEESECWRAFKQKFNI